MTPESKPTATCDPCQVPVIRNEVKEICGWQKSALRAHLKAHKKGNGRYWTIVEYQKKFPGFDIGPAMNTAPINPPKDKPAVAPPKPPPTEDERTAKIRARAEVLWNMCERDPAAESVCYFVAKDEILLEEAYDRIEKERKKSKPNYQEITATDKSIAAMSERLQNNMRSLGVTADQRRKNNQIGSDAGSQIISNYINTRRKMTPASRDAFDRRMATWKSKMEARVKATILDQVEDQFDLGVADDSADYRTAILDRNR